MSFLSEVWRSARALEFDGKDVEGFAEAVVQLVNRELTPLLQGLIREMGKATGETVNITGISYTVKASDRFIRADAFSHSEQFVILRPAAEAMLSGVIPILVKKVDSGVGKVTVKPQGSDDIERATFATLSTVGDSIELWPRTGGYDIA